MRQRAPATRGPKRVFLVALGAALLCVPAPGRSAVALGSCGWEVRSDPALANAMYSDGGTVSYVAVLPAPPDRGYYRVNGAFPHARYMSFATYNGAPIDSLADYQIAPDVGSVNPFVKDGDRTSTHRSYTVTIVPTDRGGLRPLNTMVMASGTPTVVGYLYYRISVPDAGTWPRGNVALPTISLVFPGADGDATSITCEGARDSLPDGTVVQDAIAGTSAPALPASYLRATNPATWAVASDLAKVGIDQADGADAVQGGPVANPHEEYIVASISRSLGEVFVVRAKAPSFPRTRAGESAMGEGDLRSWLFCQNSRSTRYVACIVDEDVAVDSDGWFTLVVSGPEHRPANALNWLPWGPEPDAQLTYRHMLPSDEFFPRSAQGIADSGMPVKTAMGQYYPGGVYCSTAQFEAGEC